MKETQRNVADLVLPYAELLIRGRREGTGEEDAAPAAAAATAAAGCREGHRNE